jgi:hypothetical protein
MVNVSLNVKMVRLRFNSKNYFQGILISFLVIQAISYILHVSFGVQLLKLGWLLFLFMAVVLITVLFTLGINLEHLNKKSLLFALIIFLSVVGLIIALPSIVPEIFSAYGLEHNIEYSELIKSQINSIINMGG